MSTAAELESLLATPDPAGLGPGPRAGVTSADLLQSRLDDALNKAKLSGPRAHLVRATVLLWHDNLDAAHTLVQDDASKDGSYIHAILHRREPDFSNAKYWFRRVGVHPCFGALTERVSALLPENSSLKEKFLPGGRWDAFAFVDACQEALGRAADRDDSRR